MKTIWECSLGLTQKKLNEFKDSCSISGLSYDRFSESLSTVLGMAQGQLKFGALLFGSWMAIHVLFQFVLPGETVLGVKLPDGSKLPYVMSGHLQFWLTLLITVCFFQSQKPNADAKSFLDETCTISFDSNKVSENYPTLIFGLAPLDLIYDYYVGLMTASMIFSFLLSVYLYLSSFDRGKLLAKGGNTGSAVYDFFIGRELNPRIGNLDLKEFCELRPGLIGWAVINIGMCVKAYKQNGHLSLSIVLVTLFQGLYVWDALYNERAILTTMDITTDGFGFMLAFGDLSWVPFTYTLQARYLVDRDPHLSNQWILIIVFVFFLGYYIFRSANSEKDAFRRDPDADEVKHLTFLQTARGTKLLTSGWWGMARKINYTGDWLVALSWCMLCGFDSIFPYFYAIYFLVLLVHRAFRDDEMCHEKYGDDWIEYKKRVPYMFIPGVV